ncbi:MAG TPA: hypothetical protein VI756_08175, partial [Blastocatellia bacterium]
NQYTPYYGQPSGSAVEVPASIAADAIYILSTAWQDANSFRNPLSTSNTNASGPRNAAETTVRAAFFTGQTQPSIQTTTLPNQGGGADADLDGGVHNFPRFLENWGSNYLNYTGSLVNMFPSRQAVGAYKDGGGNNTNPSVYSPPIRNWSFDTAFVNLNTMPPGTPLFQFVQLTGFHKTTAEGQ